MKNRISISMAVLPLLALFTLNLQLSTARAQGTAFTYQGRLNDGSVPAHGNYDFRFKLYADSFGNTQAGSTLLTNGVPLTNGLFTVTMDFGPGIFNGSNYWLGVGVRTNGGGGYTDLNPLQAVTPTPYAIFADTASNLSGTISSANLSGVYGGAVAFNNSSNSFGGSFTGNGANVTNVNAAALNGLGAANFWQTGGNAGTTPGVNFVGTTDNQPLELHVNGQRAMRFEPTTNNLPNLIGGISNAVLAGATGAIIGGGVNNLIGTNVTLSVIGGGGANTVRPLASWATIAGGYANTVSSINDFIGGGWTNTIAAGNYAVIVGGVGNFIGPDGFGGAGHQSVIGGGAYNTNNEYYSFIGGGQRNYIQGLADNSVIAGGGYNQIAGSYGQSVYSVIGGGYFNAMKTNTSYAVIGGGYNNSLGTASYQTIGGGAYNSIGTNSTGSAIAGGYFNSIHDSAPYGLIGAGYGNVLSGAYYDTIGGGYYNSIGTNDPSTTIAGGYFNVIHDNSYDGAIGGGSFQSIGTNSFYATIAGGRQNSVADNSTAAAIGGGLGNTASNSYATVSGGYYNHALGLDATIPGGSGNLASGIGSFAAGHFAQALHDGSFVWADFSDTPFPSTAANQFSVRATGGIRLDAGSNNVEIASGGLKITGAGVNTPTAAFVQVANSTNTSSYVTYIHNPLCDGDPNALLIATHVYNPPGSGPYSYETHPYSVWYSGYYWTIYNDDFTSISNMSFNVLIIKK
jgi:hypothetical protein